MLCVFAGVAVACLFLFRLAQLSSTPLELHSNPAVDFRFLVSTNKPKAMSIHDQFDAGSEDEKELDYVELSGSENGDCFDEDMEALKKACLRTGIDLNDLEIASAENDRPSTSEVAAASAASTDSGSDDDIEIFRSIQNR